MQGKTAYRVCHRNDIVVFYACQSARPKQTDFERLNSVENVYVRIDQMT